jgi:hypothetical protein
LAIWHDIVPEHAEEVLNWYDREHHFERLAVAGFRSVRRFHAGEGSPQLFIRYETDDVGVLSSSTYLDRLNNPTPWTVRSQPQVRNNSRTVCVRRLRAGQAEGGFAATMRIVAQDTEPLEPQIAAVAGALMERNGIIGLEYWEADPERSTIATKEKQLRGEGDHYVSAVFVVHATDRSSAEQGLKQLLGALPQELSESAQTGIYQLAFSANNATS